MFLNSEKRHRRQKYLLSIQEHVSLPKLAPYGFESQSGLGLWVGLCKPAGRKEVFKNRRGPVFMLGIVTEKTHTERLI